MPYVVYILQADDGTFYTGETKDLARRLKQHQAGRVQSTKSRTGWHIVHTEEFPTHLEAVKREREIKRRKSRKYIEKLIETSPSQSEP